MKYDLTDDQKLQNDAFFQHILHSLKEGGIFIFKSANDTLTKRGDKLIVRKRETYETLEGVLTASFFSNHIIFEAE